MTHDIGDSNVRTLITRYQQILDAYKRMWESIPFDADGCKHAPVGDDEMPDYLSRLVGRTVTAAEWQAAQRWEWEQIAGGKIVAAPPRPAEMSVQIDDYQDALQRLTKRLMRLLGHPAITNLAFADYEYNEDQYWLHTLGELEAHAKLMLEFAEQAPAAMHGMRWRLESFALAPDLVMNEAVQTAYRAVIEALDRTQAALGVPLAKRSRHFEMKHVRGAPVPPPPDANPELAQMNSDELRAALTDTRIRSEAIETEISRRATASARALAAMLVGARERLAGSDAADVEPVAAATTCEDGLQAAIKAAGGKEALARALGINPSAVEQWKRVPAERLVQVERLTNVPRNVLRPDLYPQPKDD